MEPRSCFSWPKLSNRCRNVPDPRHLRNGVWALLAAWVSLELLVSSRWWPPNPIFVTDVRSEASQDNTLKHHLQKAPRAKGQVPRVWFGPYTTFPETGVLESRVRRGVYDTLLTIPANGLKSNYGAFKLSAADTLFALASAHGLSGELRLARQLGYNTFALDLGAIQQPQRHRDLCRRSKGCLISSDHYALWSLDQPESSRVLQGALQTTSRNLPLLPLYSAGPSWGPLVLSPLQLRVSALKGQTLVVEAKPGGPWPLYRYPLRAYPATVRSWLKLSATDVTVVLGPGLDQLKLCIRTGRLGPCRVVVLNARQRSAAIGQDLPEGEISQLEILEALPQPVITSPFWITIRTHMPGRTVAMRQ